MTGDEIEDDATPLLLTPGPLTDNGCAAPDGTLRQGIEPRLATCKDA